MPSKAALCWPWFIKGGLGFVAKIARDWAEIIGGLSGKGK
jgi:hypothetical protein